VLVLFALLNSSFPSIGQEVGSHLEDIGEQVTEFVGLDSQQLKHHFSFVNPRRANTVKNINT
jgi:hypothetical protein